MSLLSYLVEDFFGFLLYRSCMFGDGSVNVEGDE